MYGNATMGYEEDDLPKDVLTTLLRNREQLGLTDEVIFREICFYLQARAHSTANAFTHTVDDILNWGQQYPEDLDKAREDLSFVQLHARIAKIKSANPVALRRPLQGVKLSDGILLNEGTEVTLDLMAVNRD